MTAPTPLAIEARRAYGFTARPWRVYVNGLLLRGKGGNERAFATEEVAKRAGIEHWIDMGEVPR